MQLAFQRAPLVLYRFGLGPLLGQRLRLTHTGRRTGTVYRTILEVIEHDQDADEYRVGAVWGPESDWFKNVRAGGASEVLIGRRTFIPSTRILGETEADAIIGRYRRRRPRWSALSERMVGRPLTAATVPIVGLKPAKRNLHRQVQ